MVLSYLDPTNISMIIATIVRDRLAGRQPVGAAPAMIGGAPALVDGRRSLSVLPVALGHRAH